MDDPKVNHPLLKVFSVMGAWAAGATWGEIASMLAAFYTLLMITDWWWKRWWKPLFIRRGWLKNRSYEFMDTRTEPVPLDHSYQEKK